MALLTAEGLMDISTLLSNVPISLWNEGFQIELGWLEKLIRTLVEGIGVTGIGIIVFTLILKAVTLPFEIYQRVKMRKQTLIMREMQPELEKLQKQYANDKATYSQKMMELYKKNGYSMFGACLPMIVSLVILIVAFQGLNTYSQYANLAMYENMVSAYNAEILSHGVGEEDKEEQEEIREDNTFVIVRSSDESKYVYYEYNKAVPDTLYYYIEIDRLKGVVGEETIQKFQTDNGYSDEKAACSAYVKDLGAQAAANAYRENPPSFLWIKNIWYPDVSYNHAIQDYKTFSKSIGKTIMLEDGSQATSVESVVTEEMYNSITRHLTEEKEQPNGYFILIVLSIALMVLSQLITMKSQKESNQYQTVDGSAMKQQKMMLIMMPLIYVIFAFMYSAAFSIYMAMSSLIGIVVTLLSNLIIGRIFAKKEQETLRLKYTRTAPGKKTDGKKK